MYLELPVDKFEAQEFFGEEQLDEEVGSNEQ